MISFVRRKHILLRTEAGHGVGAVELLHKRIERSLALQCRQGEQNDETVCERSFHIRWAKLRKFADNGLLFGTKVAILSLLGDGSTIILSTFPAGMGFAIPAMEPPQVIVVPEQCLICLIFKIIGDINYVTRS